MKTKEVKKNENIHNAINYPEPDTKSISLPSGGFQMNDTNNSEVKMEDKEEGINMGINEKKEPKVSFPEHIQYNSVFSPTSKDRVAVDKSTSITCTASDLEKETSLYIVPKGSEKKSSTAIPAAIDKPLISNGENIVNVTGNTQSASGVEYEIIAIHGKKKVIGRSNPFVVTSFPYRMFRKTGEKVTGMLGFTYDLVVSADSYADPTSDSEAIKKEDKEMEEALGRTSIMEEITTSSFGTGLFNPRNPNGFGIPSETVQLNPELITKDKLFDSNSIGLNYTQYSQVKKMMRDEYYKNKYIKTTESKLSQIQNIYFEEDIAGINLSDKVKIPQAFYSITHKLILVPLGDDQFEYKYQVEISSKDGQGFTETPIAEITF